MGTNTSDIEVRSQRDGVRIIVSDDDVQVSCPHVDVILPRGMNEQMPMPHINLSITWYDPEASRGSHTRSHDTGMQTIPQLDGPVSVQSISRRGMSENVRIKQESFWRTTTSHRREYPSKSSDDTHSDRRTYDDWRPPERRRYQGQNGRPPDRRNYWDIGYSGRGYTNQGGRPPGWGGPPDGPRGPPDNGGPPDDGRCADDGKPPGDGWHPRYPGGQGPPGAQGPPGPVRPVIVQTPQVTLDTTALENTFDTVGQSMLQLARVQDQTNRQLQQHLQQGQLNIQAHTGTLQQLTTSTYQCNFDYIFASIPIYDGSDREGFFPWLEHLEAACFYSGRNIKTEALGR